MYVYIYIYIYIYIFIGKKYTKVYILEELVLIS